jgi:hypothetical protein
LAFAPPARARSVAKTPTCGRSALVSAAGRRAPHEPKQHAVGRALAAYFLLRLPRAVRVLLGLVYLLERIEGVFGLVHGQRPRGAWRPMRARRAIRARGRTTAARARAAARHPGNLARRASPLYLHHAVPRAPRSGARLPTNNGCVLTNTRESRCCCAQGVPRRSRGVPVPKELL